MDELLIRKGDELEWKSAAELLRQLGGPPFVPRRTEGRRHDHREVFTLARYLTALARSSRLRFPLKVKKWESPDFLVTLADGTVTGVEITEAGTKESQRAATRLERSPEGSFLEGNSIRLPGEELKALPTMGDQAEKELAQLLLQAVDKKVAVLRRGHYHLADRYELLIYDNSQIFADPSIAARLLKQALAERDPGPAEGLAFGIITIVRDFGVVYDCSGEGAYFEIGDLPSLSLARNVVAPEILRAAQLASKELRDARIPHALAGGLAVSAHGYPRTTDDVDFLVGDEAFVKHEGGFVTLKLPLVAIGSVRVDFVSIVESNGEKEQLRPAVEFPPSSEGVPIVPLAALIYLKLKAGRQKDMADLVELVKRGRVDLDELDGYLAEHAPEHLRRWQKVKDLAQQEE